MHKCFSTDTCFCRTEKRKEKNQHNFNDENETRKKAIHSYKNKSLQAELNK